MRINRTRATRSLWNSFADVWNNLFPDSNFADLHVEESPMLIGVMQRSLQDRRRFSPLDYQSRVLLRHDPEELTDQSSTLPKVL